ncbi:MAG: polyprenyl synthetase family protein [Desulfurococcales archaeon]|nr:polyprenyl synthetase family protein [Desulfurococcales archaeon]
MSEALTSFINRYAPLVDSYILERVRGAPDYIYKAALHLIKAGGKRLRPVIVMTVARALGGLRGEVRALPLAAAVEVFHNFTLIHDDIMDNDDFRRGVPTVHRVWGVPKAILAGDLLFSLSFLLITDAIERGLPREEGYEALRVLASASRKVCEGQGYDVMFEETWDVDEADYLNMVYLKTGALIEASSMLGAIAAGSSKETINAMGEYGRLIGIAFQIRDDILGVFGDPAKTGKPVYNDLRQGKKTLLVIYTIKRVDDKDGFKRLLGSRNVEDLEEAARMIKSSGALQYAENLAHSYSRRAISIVSSIDMVDDEARRALIELARYVVEREK